MKNGEQTKNDPPIAGLRPVCAPCGPWGDYHRFATELIWELGARYHGLCRLAAPGATTSLQRDIAESRPSELEAWNGAVVRLAREQGVDTPTHDFVYYSLLPLELRAGGRMGFPQ